jgi:hypothetical protein
MRHRRRGVKREHSVIGDFAAVFERLARQSGVQGVIPGRIAANPTRHPGLVLKAETATGFKLFAKTTTGIQEVFLIVRDGRREAVLSELAPFLARPAAGRPAPDPDRDDAPGARRRRKPTRGRRGAGWRNPGVLPAAPWRSELVRYTADWRPTASPLGEGLDEPTRRRLLLLRLRRSRWRRRFGVPLRRAPRGAASGGMPPGPAGREPEPGS